MNMYEYETKKSGNGVLINMNEIIIAILIIMVFIGLRSTIKHFKGEGSCCGGGTTVKIKRKNIKNIVKKRTVVIEGMHCENCETRIANSFNAMADVSAVVSYKKKTAEITMGKELSDEEITNIIERLGYQVVDIR